MKMNFLTFEFPHSGIVSCKGILFLRNTYIIGEVIGLLLILLATIITVKY